MKSFERWSLIVSILGFIAVIYTIHDAATAFKSDTYSKATPWILDLDKTFVEQSQLRPYFYDNITNINSSDTNQAFALAEYILDTYDSFLSQRTRYGHQILNPDWSKWMEDTFTSSPLLVDYLKEHKDWYRSGELYRNVYLKWKIENPDKVNRALNIVVSTNGSK
jgi:hypothetical protein